MSIKVKIPALNLGSKNVIEYLFADYLNSKPIDIIKKFGAEYGDQVTYSTNPLKGEFRRCFFYYLNPLGNYSKDVINWLTSNISQLGLLGCHDLNIYLDNKSFFQSNTNTIGKFYADRNDILNRFNQVQLQPVFIQTKDAKVRWNSLNPTNIQGNWIDIFVPQIDSSLNFTIPNVDVVIEKMTNSSVVNILQHTKDDKVVKFSDDALIEGVSLNQIVINDYLITLRYNSKDNVYFDRDSFKRQIARFPKVDQLVLHSVMFSLITSPKNFTGFKGWDHSGVVSYSLSSNYKYMRKEIATLPVGNILKKFFHISRDGIINHYRLSYNESWESIYNYQRSIPINDVDIVADKFQRNLQSILVKDGMGEWFINHKYPFPWSRDDLSFSSVSDPDGLMFSLIQLAAIENLRISWDKLKVDLKYNDQNAFNVILDSMQFDQDSFFSATIDPVILSVTSSSSIYWKGVVKADDIFKQLDKDSRWNQILDNILQRFRSQIDGSNVNVPVLDKSLDRYVLYRDIYFWDKSTRTWKSNVNTICAVYEYSISRRIWKDLNDDYVDQIRKFKVFVWNPDVYSWLNNLDILYKYIIPDYFSWNTVTDYVEIIDDSIPLIQNDSSRLLFTCSYSKGYLVTSEFPIVRGETDAFRQSNGQVYNLDLNLLYSIYNGNKIVDVPKNDLVVNRSLPSILRKDKIIGRMMQDAYVKGHRTLFSAYLPSSATFESLFIKMLNNNPWLNNISFNENFSNTLLFNSSSNLGLVGSKLKRKKINFNEIKSLKADKPNVDWRTLIKQVYKIRQNNIDFISLSLKRKDVSNLIKDFSILNDDVVSQLLDDIDLLSQDSNLIEALVGHSNIDAVNKGLTDFSNDGMINLSTKFGSFEPFSDEMIDYVNSEEFIDDCLIDGIQVIDVNGFRNFINDRFNAVNIASIDIASNFVNGINNDISKIINSFNSILTLDKSKDSLNNKINELSEVTESLNKINLSIENVLEDKVDDIYSVKLIKRKLSNKLVFFDLELKDPNIILADWKFKMLNNFNDYALQSGNSEQLNKFNQLISNLKIPYPDFSKINEIMNQLKVGITKFLSATIKAAASALAIYDNLYNIVNIINFPIKIRQLVYNVNLNDNYIDVFYILPRGISVSGVDDSVNESDYMRRIYKLGHYRINNVYLSRIYIPEIDFFGNVIIQKIPVDNFDNFSQFASSVIKNRRLSELSKLISLLIHQEVNIWMNISSEDKAWITGIITLQAIVAAGSAFYSAKDKISGGISSAISSLSVLGTNIWSSFNSRQNVNGEYNDYFIRDDSDTVDNYSFPRWNVIVSSINNMSSIPLTPMYMAGSVLVEVVKMLGGFALSFIIGAAVGHIARIFNNSMKLRNRRKELIKQRNALNNQMNLELKKVNQERLERENGRNGYAKASALTVKEKKEEIKLKYVNMDNGLIRMNKSQITGMANYNLFLNNNGLLNTNIAGKIVDFSKNKLLAAASLAGVTGATIGSFISKGIRSPSRIVKNLKRSNDEDEIEGLDFLFGL